MEKDKKTETPSDRLIYGIAYGKWGTAEVSRHLAEFPDSHEPHKDWGSPLVSALTKRDVGICTLLLEAGADPLARRRWGDALAYSRKISGVFFSLLLKACDPGRLEAGNLLFCEKQEHAEAIVSLLDLAELYKARQADDDFGEWKEMIVKAIAKREAEELRKEASELCKAAKRPKAKNPAKNRGRL